MLDRRASVLDTDVLVIGAGQAGLAAGYHLARNGGRFVIAEREGRAGASWLRRYESLTLFTPRRLDELPGLLLKGDANGYPTRDEFAAYLDAYAKAFHLPIRYGFPITRLERFDGGRFLATGPGPELISARAVVVATGGFQVPVVPALSSGLEGSVVQLTPETYRNPGSIAQGPVLVVGDGASGRDIAAELSVLHTVLLSGGRRRRLLPERIFGVSIWTWLAATWLLRTPAESLLGRKMREADPFPNRGRSDRHLRDMGVVRRARLIGVHGNRALFMDGSSADVGTVIWCTGYRDEFGWLAIEEAKDTSGNVKHDKGHSPVAGLFYVGRPWQRNRASGLVLGVGEDARLTVEAAMRLCGRS